MANLALQSTWSTFEASEKVSRELDTRQLEDVERMERHVILMWFEAMQERVASNEMPPTPYLNR